MTERLLEAVLAGEWPVASALRWLDGDATASPPADLVAADPSAAWQPNPPTPDTFRACVLNFVRDQADFVLSAAEKKAAGSRAGTPNPATLASAPSTASGRPPKRMDPEHLRRLESVVRRLEPGAVDDSNFPSLGEVGGPKAGRSQEAGGGGTWAAAGAPSLASRLGGKPPPAGGPLARAASGRRIQPTQVAEVEVSTQFVTAKMAESTPALSRVVPEAVPSKLASRLGEAKLDGEVLALASPFAGKAAAAAAAAAAAVTAPTVRRAAPIPIPALSGAPGEAPATPPKAATTPSPPSAAFPSAGFGCATPQQAPLLAAPGSGALPTPLTHASSGPGAPPPGPRAAPLCPRGAALAALYSGVLASPWSRVALAEEVALLLNLLAVPLAAEVDPSLAGCGRLDVLLTCGAQAQQFAAAVLRGAGSLLRGLGPGLLEDVAAAAGEAAAALRAAGAGGADSLPASPTLPPPSPLFPNEDEDSEPGGNAAAEGENEAAAAPRWAPAPPAEALRLLRDAAAAAEAALRARQLRTEKAFNRPVSASGGAGAGTAAGGVLGGLGLHAFTADRARGRTADEQRRLSNREAVRDAWFSLMRGAADRAASFGAEAGARAGGGGRPAPALSLSLASGADGRGGAEEPDGVAFGRLQAAAAALLRTLRPDNFGAFAGLVTAAVLQAAATGEALLAEDEELTRLAKRDGASRLHSLNQRMQGPGAGTGGAGAGPRRGPAAGGALQRLGSGAASTTIGFSGSFSQLPQAGHAAGPQMQQPRHQRKGSNSANSSPAKGGGRARPGSAAANKRGGGGAGAQLFGGGNTGGGGPGGHHPGQTPAGAQAAMDEAAAAAATVMSEFPRALRPYIMFLEAADSHRLNAALSRAMAAKLRALAVPEAAPAAAAAQGLGEKVVASSALAGMLGYLAFAKGGAGARPARWDGGAGAGGDAFDGSHPVDVAGAVRAAMGSSALLRTLPWAGRYLSFLRFDPEATGAPYFQALLRVLCDLRDAPELAPSSPAFGPAAFCLRAALDGLAASGLPLPPAAPPPSAPAAAEPSLFAADLQTADQSIDLRYIDLCCPLLAAGRRLLSGDAAARGRATTRRIQASAPRATAAAAAPPPPSGAGEPGAAGLPPAAAAAAAAAEDPVKLRLQQTFLAQYSEEGSLVKLKDVVEYASDVIGCNAAAAAVGAAAPPAADAAGAQLVAAAEVHAASLSGNLAIEGLTAAEALYKAQIELDRFVNAAAERAAAATIESVVSTAFEAAQTPIRVAAARAVLGLTSPELGEAVAATAAAIVAETAAAAAAGRLAGLTQRAVRQEALAQRARAAGRAMLKEAALAAAAAAAPAAAL